MKLVIAGSYQQYRKWLGEHPEDKDSSRYVYEPSHVQGMRGAEVVLVGSYWRNRLGSPEMQERVAEMVSK